MSQGVPGDFRINELPEPVPGPAEVLVEVKACGVNHLDLWLEQGALPMSVRLPRVPGSEIAGRIARLGADVDEWQVGDRVAVQSNLFCGHCEFCQRGDESLCLEGRLLGIDCDGGFAERVVVPWQALLPLPDALDYATGAALTLAASTAMHMLTNRCEVRTGDWVLVMGGNSGVGSGALQIARELGARVIATGASPEKLALSHRLGAEWTVNHTQPNWSAEVRKITAKRGVDIVVEHLGGEFLKQAFHCLARGGTIVTCGATAGRELPMDVWPFFVKQQRLIGSYGRDRADLAATLEWAAEGKLKPVIDQQYPLAQAPDALARLRQRQVMGKLLIIP